MSGERRFLYSRLVLRSGEQLRNKSMPKGPEQLEGGQDMCHSLYSPFSRSKTTGQCQPTASRLGTHSTRIILLGSPICWCTIRAYCKQQEIKAYMEHTHADLLWFWLKNHCIMCYEAPFKELWWFYNTLLTRWAIRHVFLPLNQSPALTAGPLLDGYFWLLDVS